MRHAWLAVLVLAALLVWSGPGDADASPYDAEELRVLRLINEYREDKGLRPLLLSDTLSVAAERHSEDMGKRSFFAHDTVSSPHYREGAEPWDRMEAEGYDYNTYKGENIAAGFETAEKAFRAWRESPSHNRAMLDGKYRVVGIGRINVPGSRYGWYWTTDFGAKVDPSAHAPGERPRGQRKPADGGGIENGSLDSAAIWRQEAEDGAELIVDGRARLGGYDDGEDGLRQKVRLGRDDALSYGLKIVTDEQRGGPSDRLVVRLADEEGRALEVLARHTDAEAGGGWRRERVDLSRFADELAGKTVWVEISVRTDDEDLTTFYLDDVALRRG